MAEGQDDEPCNTRDQNADAVDENGGKKSSKAGWIVVDPTA